MTSKELKKLLRLQFPSLKKQWPWSDDPITVRDMAYESVNHRLYTEADARCWQQIIKRRIEYKETFPDCDDFADIKLGLFKLEWVALIHGGEVPGGVAPSYGVCDGYNPQGVMHDFNVFVADKQIYVSDYGYITDPTGYKPIKIRF